MMAPDAALSGLKRQRPEWAPWLAVVEEILREAGTATWDVAVPSVADSGADAPGADARRVTIPKLAGAALALPAMPVRRLFERLIRIASRTGTPKMATLESAAHARLDMLPLLAASLGQDSERLADFAAAAGADPEAFQAVVALLSVPLLHACNRRWTSSIAESWVEGYVPFVDRGRPSPRRAASSAIAIFAAGAVAARGMRARSTAPTAT